MAEDASGAGHGQAPIIIKKKKGGDHGHHGGAWKIAYADMVTALMALFIVLWILSQSDEVIDNVAHYFKNPVGFSEGGQPSPMPGSSKQGQPTVVEVLQPMSSNAGESGAKVWKSRAEEIREALEKLPSYALVRDQIDFSVTPEGLRINLLESNETPLFESGGFGMTEEGYELLATIAKEIKRHPSAVVVEGHTDGTPFDKNGVTNWELSTGRANTARQLLEEIGFPVDRILEVRGFADRQLYNPLDITDSRNRRVSILLLSKEATEERQVMPEEKLMPWLDS